MDEGLSLYHPTRELNTYHAGRFVQEQGLNSESIWNVTTFESPHASPEIASHFIWVNWSIHPSIDPVLCLERIKGFLMIHSNTRPIICLSRRLQLAWHQPDLRQIREKVVLWKLKCSTHKPVGRLSVPLFCRGVCFRNFGDKTQTHSNL